MKKKYWHYYGIWTPQYPLLDLPLQVNFHSYQRTRYAIQTISCCYKHVSEDLICLPDNPPSQTIVVYSILLFLIKLERRHITDRKMVEFHDIIQRSIFHSYQKTSYAQQTISCCYKHILEDLIYLPDNQPSRTVLAYYISLFRFNLERMHITDRKLVKFHHIIKNKYSSWIP